MIALTVQQRAARRYAATKSEGDREVRAANQPQPVASSTPNLQLYLESPKGILLMLCIGLMVFLLYAPLGAFL